jgi:hypothetical protein
MWYSLQIFPTKNKGLFRCSLFSLFSLMNNFNYILDKSSKKFHCPQCEKKRFVRYINADTNEYLPEIYGRCDRESKCNYHLNPYTDGYGKVNCYVKRTLPITKPKTIITKVAYIPKDELKGTLKGYENNVFVQNLSHRVKYPFPEKDLERVISMYYLGTVINGYRSGGITFPFIDKKMNVRAIQVKQFNQNNHTITTDFIHSIIERTHNQNNEPLPMWLQSYLRNESKVSCLFGEHLLEQYPNNPIGLVEAPKTAIIATLYFGFPETSKDLIWLAVYNKSTLTAEKCKALHGRNVILFPDLNAFDDWSHRAKRIEGVKFKVSDILEKNASDTERANGFDLADYLINRDWRKFRREEVVSVFEELITKSEKSEKSESPKQRYIFQPPKPEIETTLFELQKQWYCEMLEAQFKGEPTPENTLKLGRCESIEDVKQLLASHQPSSEYKHYSERLENLKQLLTVNMN